MITNLDDLCICYTVTMLYKQESTNVIISNKYLKFSHDRQPDELYKTTEKRFSIVRLFYRLRLVTQKLPNLFPPIYTLQQTTFENIVTKGPIAQNNLFHF